MPASTIDLGAVCDWLAGLDSHSVYSIDKFQELEALGVDTSRFSRQSHAQVKRSIEERGLGGWLDPLKPGQTNGFFTGWVVASQLYRQLTGEQENPGSAYFGRGTSFRADLAGLRKFAEAQS